MMGFSGEYLAITFRYYRKRLLHDQVQQLVMWVSPHGVQLPVEDIFYRNVGVHGGPVPARAYMPELLDDILKGHINPGRVFDFTTDLDDIEQANNAKNERLAIKSLVKL